jgi:exportin-1
MASNKEFVMHSMKNVLQSMFMNMNAVQIEGFVLKLFNTLRDWKEFKDTIRDLLVSMKSFASKDDSYYEEERTAALNK